MILVIGATGTVGTALCAAVVDKTIFRLALRDRRTAPPGFESVPFDLARPATYAPALVGISSVFLLVPPQLADRGERIDALLRAAKRAGIAHIVFLSVRNADRLPFLPHRQVERAIEASSIGWTHLRPERQAAKMLRSTGRKPVTDGGPPSMVMTRVEDANAPDHLILVMRTTAEATSANERGGENEQQLCRAIVVFLFTYWDDVTRYGLANALGVEKNTIILPVMGDLRLLRHAILHDRGRLTEAAGKRFKVLGHQHAAGEDIQFTHAKMHELFRLIDAHLGRLTLQLLDVPAPPGGWSDIRSVAIDSGQLGRPERLL